MGLPATLGPPSLTNPVIQLSDGSLLLSVESNKHYDDASRWFQRVVTLRSSDGVAAALDDMRVWSYGLPYAEALNDGDVMVVYYAGEPQAMELHYARLSL